MVSEQVTKAYKIFKVIPMISLSLVFKAAINWINYKFYSLLTGMINYGITGKTLAPPFSSISKTPWTAKNRYGSCFSLMPSKKIGR
jgi:hypothetical protein